MSSASKQSVTLEELIDSLEQPFEGEPKTWGEILADNPHLKSTIVRNLADAEQEEDPHPAVAAIRFNYLALLAARERNRQETAVRPLGGESK